MKFRLVESIDEEEFNYSRTFSCKEDAEEYAQKYVSGYYVIEDGEDPESVELKWNINRLTDHSEPKTKQQIVWGNSFTHNEDFVNQHKDELHGLTVYYIVRPDNTAIKDRNGKIIFYIDKEYAAIRSQYLTTENTYVQEYKI